MNFRMIGRLLSEILAIEAILMLPALGISLYNGESASALSFLYTIIITLVIAGVIFLICRKSPRKFYAREGMVCVGASWLIMSLIGCLPFMFSGAIPNYIDALFETVSGFTTTGASILSDVEVLPKGLLYWRSFTHWLGGMGVIVFLMVFISTDKKGSGSSLHLLRAESPGPDVGKLGPRMKHTASVLYLIYIALTITNVIFLLAGGLPLLDSVCIAFGTAGTGGFGIRNDSIASYSPYVQIVCTVFMFLFGVNFSCYYLLILKKFKAFFRDEELRLYFGITVGATIMVGINLIGSFTTLTETFRHSAFQVVSIMTTTGFSSVDFDMWPAFSKGVLLCLMLIGACAGSTGGGIKCIRILMLFKSLRRSIRQLLYPKKVQVVRINDTTINESVLKNVDTYLAAYCGIMILSFLLISIDGFSVETNVSAVFACFNNIGPGLDAVGPACNYAGYGILSKLVLIFDMLAGRLEIFPMLVMLSSSTWRRK